ncbi:MAG TPA: thymidine phosphorylase [Clostridia bacterium]|nr:thymidine phosphorylase [Clostridia bacterium]
MNIIDIIEKKKFSQKLSREEIEFFVSGIVEGSIADYQTSALLMAIRLNGMDNDETFYLTDAMKNSGDVLNFDNIKGIKVDKHSTGGVGDSTTFVVAPIVAALGFKVAKLSGRGLGFTGGTLDKLEAIKGLSVTLSQEKFEKQVSETGLAVVGQSANICPADKILYALRDVTATVDSIPLIASSIMSKKLAVSADILVLDVKVGDGSLLNNYEKTKQLAQIMVAMGKKAGKKVSAILTSMDEPLDEYVGNSLEVEGAIAVLKGARNNLYKVSKAIVKEILILSGDYDDKCADVAIDKALESGKAYAKFEEFILAQGGESLSLAKAKMYEIPVLSKEEGYISKVHTRELGMLVMRFGGGRLFKDDKIDTTVGLKILKRVGDFVRVGEPICLAYANTEKQLEVAQSVVNLFEFSNVAQDKTKLIYEIVR